MTFDPDLLANWRAAVVEVERGIAQCNVHEVWFWLRSAEDTALVLRNSLPPLQVAVTDEILMG